MKDLVFILSLPRSGSTFLQRILMTGGVRSHSEPWLLMPFLKCMKKTESYSEVSDSLTMLAYDSYVKKEIGEDYVCELYSKLYSDLYSKACKDGAIYLDKTPRYSYYARQIRRIFPEAKIIVLYRNPIDIVSSLMDTWAKGRWNLFRHGFDLYDCQKELDFFVMQDKENVNTFVLKYEDILCNKDNVVKELEDFLGVSFSLEDIDNQTTRLNGPLGDKIGIKSIQGIRKVNRELHSSLVTPVRRLWMRKYIDWLKNNLQAYPYCEDDFNRMGSCKDISIILSINDLFRVLYGYFNNIFLIEIFTKRIKKRNQLS